MSKKKKDTSVIDYNISSDTSINRLTSWLIGFAAGFVIFFVFYKIILLSVIGGVLIGTANIFLASKKNIEKRKMRLRTQFYDLLEAMSVSMRAGNPPYKALISAREDLMLLYPEKSDIIRELDLIIGKFNNAVPLSEAFSDFADRSGLEDIESFASIYATIEGKSSKANEIIRETQEIIADKMSIEMEIDTMMTGAKSEANIMLFMPLGILLILGYMGQGFMDAIYTTPVGRLTATFGLVIFVVSFVLTQKFSDVKL